jgi:hypothetical protein
MIQINVDETSKSANIVLGDNRVELCLVETEGDFGGRVEMTVFSNHTAIASSRSTQDWGILDRIFEPYAEDQSLINSRILWSTILYEFAQHSWRWVTPTEDMIKEEYDPNEDGPFEEFYATTLAKQQNKWLTDYATISWHRTQLDLRDRPEGMAIAF